MATTPNYGWVTPAPTDFVTDLPADFETFADAVDADLAGLLGGTTGQVLTKDSATDHDFSWQTPSAPAFVGVSVFNSTNQTIASSTAVDLAFNSENFDTNSFHDNVTNNGELKMPFAGYYRFDCSVEWTNNDATPTGVCQLILRKNGTQLFIDKREYLNGAEEWSQTLSFTDLAAANDIYTIRVFQSGGNSETIYGTSDQIYFTATYLGA